MEGFPSGQYEWIETAYLRHFIHIQDWMNIANKFYEKYQP